MDLLPALQLRDDAVASGDSNRNDSLAEAEHHAALAHAPGQRLDDLAVHEIQDC